MVQPPTPEEIQLALKTESPATMPRIAHHENVRGNVRDSLRLIYVVFTY